MFSSRQAANEYMYDLCSKFGLHIVKIWDDNHDKTYICDNGVTFYIQRAQQAEVSTTSEKTVDLMRYLGQRQTQQLSYKNDQIFIRRKCYKKLMPIEAIPSLLPCKKSLYRGKYKQSADIAVEWNG